VPMGRSGHKGRFFRGENGAEPEKLRVPKKSLRSMIKERAGKSGRTKGVRAKKF
jgi:hypothetical protein